MKSKLFTVGESTFRVFSIPDGAGSWSMRVDDERGRWASLIFTTQYSCESDVFQSAAAVVTAIAEGRHGPG